MQGGPFPGRSAPSLPASASRYEGKGKSVLLAQATLFLFNSRKTETARHGLPTTLRLNGSIHVTMAWASPSTEQTLKRYVDLGLKPRRLRSEPLSTRGF